MYIGIDLGGTNIAAGLVSSSFTILRKASLPTNPARGPQAVAADMAGLARGLCEAEGVAPESVDAVGIGSPGSINGAEGIITFASNLGFERVPICAIFREHWPDTPVFLENDANAAALGEALAGAAKGHSNALCVTLGTGVGCGIIIGGKIYGGSNGAAGEVGHHVVVLGGAPCACGRRGCWEAYASATGLIALTKEAMERHPHSRMHEVAARYGKVSGRTSFTAAREGCPAARETVELYMRYLACGLANLVNILQPEIICLGGGVANEGEELLGPLRGLTEQECFKAGGPPVLLRQAALGNDAGIIGAAFIGL
jgi:glucokinase